MAKLEIRKVDRIKAIAWLDAQIENADDKSTLVIEIKRKSKKRSLSANAYAWLLLGKLSEHYKLPPELIYRREVRDIGGNSVEVTLDAEAVEATRRAWECRGLGWIAEIIGEHNGKADLRLVYGSSAYDTTQMARLIDNIIQECRQAGIETMEKNELDSLLRQWEENRK